MPCRVHCTRWYSPVVNVISRFDKPAKVICHPPPTKGSPPCSHFLDNTDPTAQLSEPPSKLTDAIRPQRPRVLPLKSWGQSSTTIPAIPSTMPASPRREM